MTDLISKQAAINLFPNDALEWDTNGGYIAPHLVRRMIEELPSAQSKIIRCKDCTKFITEEDQTYCLDMYGQCDENGFCAWAKRKEE